MIFDDMMNSQVIKWCTRNVSKYMIRPSHYALQDLSTVEKFCTKIPEFSQNIKCIRTSQGNEIYYVHLDYNYDNTIIYSHANGKCLISVGFLQELCEKLQCNGVYYDYSGFGVSAGEYCLKRKDSLCLKDISQEWQESERQFESDTNKLLNQLGLGDIKYVADQNENVTIPQLPDFMYDESTFVSDIMCIFEYLTNECQIASNRITLFGNQIGTFPTIKLATLLSKQNVSIKGVVLERIMGSVLRLCVPGLFKTDATNRKNKTMRILDQMDVFNNFDIVDKITDYPVLFMHDKGDFMCSFEEAKQMYDKCCKVNDNVVQPLWVENSPIYGMHLESVPDPQDERLSMLRFRSCYLDALKTFLQ